MIKDDGCDQDAGRGIRVCQEQEDVADYANETQCECVIPPATFNSSAWIAIISNV